MYFPQEVFQKILSYNARDRIKEKQTANRLLVMDELIDINDALYSWNFEVEDVDFAYYYYCLYTDMAGNIVKYDNVLEYMNAIAILN